MNKTYKTFDDLQFNPWLRLNDDSPAFIKERYRDAKQALIQFPNGYGASVLIGTMFYSNGVDTYEIACMCNGSLVYPEGTSFSCDVVGYCSKERITELMKEIQDMKECIISKDS